MSIELKKEFEGIGMGSHLIEINWKTRGILGRLKSEAIWTVEQLLDLSEEDIKKIKGFQGGGASYEELIETKRKLEMVREYLVENQKKEDIKIEEDRKRARERELEFENDPIENYIEGLDLSVRAYNLIKRAGIHRTEELFSKSEEELSQIKGLGPLVMAEIRAKKAEFSKEPSELEVLRTKKAELSEKSETLEKQTRDAKELLSSYEKLSGDKDNTDPDFKDE